MREAKIVTINNSSFRGTRDNWVQRPFFLPYVRWADRAKMKTALLEVREIIGCNALFSCLTAGGQSRAKMKTATEDSSFRGTRNSRVKRPIFKPDSRYRVFWLALIEVQKQMLRRYAFFIEKFSKKTPSSERWR